MMEFSGIPAAAIPAGCIIVSWGKIRALAVLSFLAGWGFKTLLDMIGAKLPETQDETPEGGA